MKFIFMSLTLFVITNPVLAEQSVSPGKCQEKLGSYFNGFEMSQSQPQALLLYFADICMPEAAHSEDPRYFKLLQRTHDEPQVITIQANSSGQGWMAPLDRIN